MIVITAEMFPLSRVMQRRLVAASAAAAFSLFPLTAAAAGGAEVDALWNQPQGVAVDSAFYLVQAWWDGLTRTAQHDPTQRGLDELAEANTDLLNAYTLLQQQRSSAGAQPVAVIDPLLTSVYNFVTGANAKAPVGCVFQWANQSLLKLEGRGSTDDIVASLFKDYRSKQAAADRDLHLSPGSELATLWTANAARESAFLVKIKSVTTDADGLLAILIDADQSTTALAAEQPATPLASPTATSTSKASKDSVSTPTAKVKAKKKP